MPSSHHLDIDEAVDERGRKVLVAIGDVDLQTAPVLRARIEASCTPGEDLVIDLRYVSFMDSPGLGTLIYADRRQRERGCRLVLKDPQGPVKELFHVVHLDHVIDVE